MIDKRLHADNDSSIVSFCSGPRMLMGDGEGMISSVDIAEAVAAGRSDAKFISGLKSRERSRFDDERYVIV